LVGGEAMSAKEKKREAPMPMSGAGLMRFFEDETEGIKIQPTYVMIFAASIIAVVIVGHLLALL
jgi:preprotein translocase subunit Sec61beta